MELDVIKALLAPGAEFPFSASISLPPQDVSGETVTFDTVTLSGQYSALDNTVRLEGELTTVVHAACALCMQPAEIPVAIPFDEMFRKGINELEDEAFVYEGSRVPLTQMTLTLIMLNLPMRFLCREGCKGSEAYRMFKRQHIVAECEEQPQTRRPFEVLRGMLGEEAGKTDEP